MFVKVCGVTSEEDALLAVAMDADAVGFNFVSGSPRQIAPTVARDIIRRLPPEVIAVGVFRNEVPERVVSIVHEAGLRGAQLHGHESPEDSRWVAERVPLMIRAFSAGDAALDRVAEYGTDVVMVDGRHPGSGESYDLGLVPDLPDGIRLILAGGLTADNVAAAIERVRPWGVDAASGVERDPGAPGGKKDPSKVRRFVAHARAAAPAWTPDVDPRPYDWTEDT